MTPEWQLWFDFAPTATRIIAVKRWEPGERYA